MTSSDREKPDCPGGRKPALEEYASRPQIGIVREFAGFLVHNKKWWLAPIILVLLLLALLVVLEGTPLGPLIYTLF
jgi:uncharacterized membrane protein YjdF